MSDDSTLKQEPMSGLEEQQVVDYLRQHPEFFGRQSELLHELHLPHQLPGAVSLVERQSRLLRDRNRELQQRLHELMDAAHHNDLQFEKTKRLILAMVEATTLDQLAVVLDEGLCQDFSGDLTRLLLFTGGQPQRDGNLCCLPRPEIGGSVGELLAAEWAICGQLDAEQCAFLFQDDAARVLSAAVIPLIKEGSLGLLAIGSYEAHYFHSSMGTLFLNYLGEVLSRILAKQLDPQG